MFVTKLVYYDSEQDREAGIRQMRSDGWKVCRITPRPWQSFEVQFSRLEARTLSTGWPADSHLSALDSVLTH